MHKPTFIAHVLMIGLTAGWLAACAGPAPRPTPDTVPPPAQPAPSPPPAPAPAPAPAATPNIAQEVLAAHNFWRKQVKSEPLVWSDELAKQAREWALTMLRKGSLEHRPGSSLGQNIAWFAGERLKPTDVVDNWGNEIEYYDYERNICLEDADCQHYTQIVWKNSRKVGCASAWGEHPKYGIQEYWVCNYSPAGNMKGLKPY